MNDISFDLETLATSHDAAILSIGAQKFHRHTGELGAKFYAEINIDSAIKHGHVSGDTLAWWIGQGRDALRLFADNNDKVQLADALRGLDLFIGDSSYCVWGNGATFDITILENAYAQFGVTPPWKFWNIRDMRTLADVAAEIGFDKASVAFMGTPHHALHDATHQARVIAAAWDYTITRAVAPLPEHSRLMLAES